jgi:NADPH:quinone reductase-like Zn-dependent oxidoreductase
VPPLSVDDVIKIVVGATGGAGMSALFLWLFLRDALMTKSASDNVIKIITAGYDKVIAEKDQRIDEYRRQRDQYWDIVNRNAGSQQTQATAIAEVTDAILAALHGRTTPRVGRGGTP